MKKYLLTLLTLFVILAPNVKADTLKVSQSKKYEDLTYCGNSSCGEDYTTVMSEFMQERNATKYKYYVIWYEYAQTDKIWMYQWNDSSVTCSAHAATSTTLAYYGCSVKDGLYTVHTNAGDGFIYSYEKEGQFVPLLYPSLVLLDTNFKFVLEGVSYEISGIYDDAISISPGNVIPSYNDLKKYNSWAEYPKEDTRTTTVDLDNYEYVILNLKDYNQDKAFNTNLKVKGSVGITPIYNFGQTEKSDIIGTKIEDRCNVKYDEFTDYRLSILKQDLKNNAVYIVKSCEEGSSFKFDNTIFNVTYVTADNVDDPVVTIGGKDYHTIPFNKLTSSANQNEEENYVPGESKKLNLSDIVSNITNTVSSFWDSIVNFMSLVTKFFNTLPIEIKGVAITTFSMACMIALIKFLKS